MTNWSNVMPRSSVNPFQQDLFERYFGSNAATGQLGELPFSLQLSWPPADF